MGKLNLVDLAGSERQSKTGATGEQAMQGPAPRGAPLHVQWWSRHHLAEVCELRVLTVGHYGEAVLPAAVLLLQVTGSRKA